MRSLPKSCVRSLHHALRYRSVKVGSDGESPIGASHRRRPFQRQAGYEVRESSGDLRRRAKDFVAQAQIDRKPRGQLHVVLRKGREVVIALISTKDASTCDTVGYVAGSGDAAILCRTLANQKIFKARNL